MPLSVSVQGILGSSTWNSQVSVSTPQYPGAVLGSDVFSGNGRTSFIQATGYTVPRLEGGGFNITSYDFTSGKTIVWLPLRFIRSEFNAVIPTCHDTYANGGFSVAFRSGSGNWRRYKIAGSDISTFATARYKIGDSGSFLISIDINSSGDYSDIGTFNPAAVDRLEILVSRINSGTFYISASQCFAVRSPILTGTTNTGDLFNYFNGYSSSVVVSSIVFSSLSTANHFSLLPAIQIGSGAASVTFSDSFAIEFPGFQATYPVLKKLDATTGLILRGSSSGSSITIANSRLTSSSTFVLDASSLQGTFSCNNLVVSGPAIVSLNSVYNQINGGFFGCRQISLNGGTLRNLSISGSTDSTSAILYPRTVGGVLTGIALSGSISSGLSIDLQNGSADLSGLGMEISNNANNDILITNTGASTGTTYTLNISGITSPAGNTTTAANRIRVADSNATNTYNITVNSSYSSSNASSAGATVNIIAPRRDTAISGFPTANNANGVAPAPVLGLYNSSFVFIAGFSTSSPEYSAGTFTILLSAYPTCAYVVGDAIGWIRTAYIPVDVSNPPAALSVAPAFTQITDETLRPIVGLGNATKKARLNYNQAAGRFEIDAGEIDFYSTLDRKEDLTSNVTGLQTFDTTVVRGIRFVANKYGYEVQLPAPLTAAAAAAAATSPILENFLLLRAGTPTADPFTHDLSSTAPGLTSRPEVRINNTRFIAAMDTDISGLPTRSEFNARTLPSSQYSTLVAANLPDISGLPTRSEFNARTLPSSQYSTLVAANLPDISGLPTRSEFNARTLPSSQYSTLVAETIETLLQAALEGLSTGGLGPEDIARLERIENQLIADTRKGATRYKRLLPGTEVVILDKDVSYNPLTGFTLTEHQEPPP
jgi:hypothetical protein